MLSATCLCKSSTILDVSKEHLFFTCLPPLHQSVVLFSTTSFSSRNFFFQKLYYRRLDLHISCGARRRLRSEEEEEEEEYGQNLDIAMLELYSERNKNVVLRVRALVDDVQEEVLIFKGFSSSLSFRTSPDPSKSVLPARAIIVSIDRIKGPFNPSNIEYLEQDIAWDVFKTRLQSNTI